MFVRVAPFYTEESAVVQSKAVAGQFSTYEIHISQARLRRTVSRLIAAPNKDVITMNISAHSHTRLPRPLLLSLSHTSAYYIRSQAETLKLRPESRIVWLVPESNEAGFIMRVPSSASFQKSTRIHDLNPVLPILRLSHVQKDLDEMGGVQDVIDFVDPDPNVPFFDADGNTVASVVKVDATGETLTANTLLDSTWVLTRDFLSQARSRWEATKATAVTTQDLPAPLGFIRDIDPERVAAAKATRARVTDRSAIWVARTAEAEDATRFVRVHVDALPNQYALLRCLMLSGDTQVPCFMPTVLAELHAYTSTRLLQAWAPPGFQVKLVHEGLEGLDESGNSHISTKDAVLLALTKRMDEERVVPRTEGDAVVVSLGGDLDTGMTFTLNAVPCLLELRHDPNDSYHFDSVNYVLQSGDQELVYHFVSTHDAPEDPQKRHTLFALSSEEDLPQVGPVPQGVYTLRVRMTITEEPKTLVLAGAATRVYAMTKVLNDG